MKPNALFDLHCDTLYECLRQKKHLDRNDLHFSFEKASEFPRFTQVLAVWSDAKDSEDVNFSKFLRARELLDTELASPSVPVTFCRSAEELAKAERRGENAVILAVEGGKLIGNDLQKLDRLYEAGVRLLTLVWNQTCAIGGAHDTDQGLTLFGREVVKRCLSLGILPDLSHASGKMTDEVLTLCEETGSVCLATHSNSFSVCHHRRNLTDDRFQRLVSLGGICGISLCTYHLTDRESCTVENVAEHILHGLSLGGENAICLGCDLDGVESLPEPMHSVADLEMLADCLARHGVSDRQINQIFSENAGRFFKNHLGKCQK